MYFFSHNLNLSCIISFSMANIQLFLFLSLTNPSLSEKYTHSITLKSQKDLKSYLLLTHTLHLSFSLFQASVCLSLSYTDVVPLSLSHPPKYTYLHLLSNQCDQILAKFRHLGKILKLFWAISE